MSSVSPLAFKMLLEQRALPDVIDHFNNTLESLQNCEISVDPVEALKIAIQYKISLYDAHFIALAKAHDIFLITEDKEIIKRCPLLSLDLRGFLKMS